MEKREKFVDIARGFAILLMILGHVLEEGMIRNFIYSFHMPLFIIVSGMFYKQKSLKKFLKDIIINLFIPYTVFLLITDCILFLGKTPFENIVCTWLKQSLFSVSYMGRMNYSNLLLTGVLWFIPLLISVKLIFFVIKKIFNNNTLGEYVSCCILTCIGITLGALGYYLPFSLDVALACMLFYYIGYILYSSNILKQFFNDKNLLMLMIAIWILGIVMGGIEIAVRNYQSIFAYMAAICGSIVVLKFSSFCEYKEVYTNNFFAWCGKNSLYILLIHYIEEEIFNYRFLKNIFNENFAILAETLIKIIICIILAGIFVKINKIFVKLNTDSKKVVMKEKEIEKISCD